MSERKHESDMTRQEKRQLQKEQLLSTHGKDRIGYIWSYYKPQIFITVVLVIICICVIKGLLNLRYDQILYVGTVNCENCDGERMAADYRKYIGNDDKFDMVDVDTSMMIDTTGKEEGSTVGYMGTIKLVSQTSAAILDVLIMDETVFETYKSTDLFAKLDTYLDEEKYKELIIEDKGLDLSGNQKLASYGIDTDRPVYLMINSETKNKEYVKQYVDFLFSEE